MIKRTYLGRAHNMNTETATKSKETIKNTGATFTPQRLADFLAEEILSHVASRNISVLDPSCGEGELLNAIGAKLSQSDEAFSLMGYDSDNGYLSIARERLRQYNQPQNNLVYGDFLELTALPEADLLTPSLFDNDNSQELVDVVIANPPYVRTQILGSEEAQRLAQKFNLKGRVDLYYPFLISMTARLKTGGILGVITSNRYLSTKSGESIRSFLAENYEILEVIDLGDTKLFDAAVLPAIFIGRKKDSKSKETTSAKFIKIYQELNGYNGKLIPSNDIYDVLKNGDAGYFVVDNTKYKKSIGTLKCIGNGDSSWEMLNIDEALWVSKIEANSKFKIGDLFKVRVGIKTTADKVFISEKWDDILDGKPEEILLKDLISQENIERWGSKENLKLKILYTHFSDNGKKRTINLKNYPNAKKYLERNAEQLKSRTYVTEAGREWFEIWVSHNPDLWELPKLVFPDISNVPRFFFDSGGKLVNGNCYWIVGKGKGDIDALLLIQGVANSKLMTKYHDLVFNNKLYSGRRRYLTQYVEKYPMPDPASPYAKEIVRIVKKLNVEINLGAITLLEQDLEFAVANAFEVPVVSTLH